MMGRFREGILLPWDACQTEGRPGFKIFAREEKSIEKAASYPVLGSSARKFKPDSYSQECWGVATIHWSGPKGRKGGEKGGHRGPAVAVGRLESRQVPLVPEPLPSPLHPPGGGGLIRTLTYPRRGRGSCPRPEGRLWGVLRPPHRRLAPGAHRIRGRRGGDIRPGPLYLAGYLAGQGRCKPPPQ